MAKTAIIIGAGPAGLTAAYELLTRTGIKPLIIEQDPLSVGGISRTINYKGNRMDIGGHRFFSKSDRVMRWWAEMLPIAIPKKSSIDITYQRRTRALTEGLRRATPADGKNVLHVRPRKSRIIYGGTFFSYPVVLSLDTLSKLGFAKVVKIGLTYLYAVLFPIRPEKTLEEFFLNRFGRELYTTFFKSYTEKVWGIPCTEMSAEWGAQRVKGLSIGKAIMHAVRKLLPRRPGERGETSLIEYFLYPTYGPGQMWESVAQKIRELGGELYMGTSVVAIRINEGGADVDVRSTEGTRTLRADYVFSTTDVRSLISMLNPEAPPEIKAVAEGLQYRDFITVGLLLKERPSERGVPLLDTWMYIHEPDVRACRVQLFHNWQPALVKDSQHGWIGLEYFCTKDDDLWRMNDDALVVLASAELKKIGLRNIHVIDGTVIRQPKAYPGYFGSYEHFDRIQRYLDGIPRLFPIGRNGMHRYNNQDHSMLAAMESVDMIAEGRSNKSALWNINTESEYHENKE